MRQKPGICQALFATLLEVFDRFLTLPEVKERNLPWGAGELITKMYAPYMELETNIPVNYRSLETRLLLV